MERIPQTASCDDRVGAARGLSQAEQGSRMRPIKTIWSHARTGFSLNGYGTAAVPGTGDPLTPQSQACGAAPKLRGCNTRTLTFPQRSNFDSFWWSVTTLLHWKVQDGSNSPEAQRSMRTLFQRAPTYKRTPLSTRNKKP